MKLEKAVTCLWGCALSFLLSFAGTAALATAFEMTVDISALAMCSLFAGCISSICYTLSLGLVPLGSGAVLLGYFWQKGSFLAWAEALLNRVSRQYDKAYGWGVIRWSERTVEEMELLLTPALCVVSVMLAIAVAWAVCRRKTMLCAVVLSLLPMVACLVVTDSVPAEPWLYFWLLGFIMLLLTNTTRRQDSGQGNRLSAMVALPVALSLLILLAAFPQERYHEQVNPRKIMDTVLNMEPVRSIVSYFTESETTGSVLDGRSVDLKSVGYRMASQAEVMRIRTDLYDVVYLRGRALDTYDGVSWTDSGSNTADLEWPAAAPMELKFEVTVATRYAHHMLYVPYNTVSRDLQYMTVGLENEKKLSQYSFTCQKMADEHYFSLLYPTPDTWRYTDPEEKLKTYTHLDDSVKQWAEPLAQQLTAGIVNHYHKAQAIGDYVRASARYDTDTRRMPGNRSDFAKWFLEESETGYCVHFATAATVLLQAAGIPARYVTGYMIDMGDKATEIIRGEHAHAWAEYWLPGYGWTVLEATPAAQEDESSQSTEQTTQTEMPEETTVSQPDQTEDALRPTEQPGKTPEQNPKTVDLTALWAILCVVALAGAIEGQRRLRLYLRSRQQSKADTNSRAILLWHQSVRLASLLKEKPEPELFRLAQMAKFSQHTLTPEQLQRFDTYILQAQQRLQKHSVFRNFWYRWVLVVY